jgi:hypothetical protein
MRVLAFCLLLVVLLSCLVFGFLKVAAEKRGEPLSSGAILAFGLLVTITVILVPGLPLLRRRLSSRYDPNGLDVESRKSLGQRLAFHGEVLQRVYQERSKEPVQQAVSAMARGPKRQLVGEKCVLCGKSVDSILEGAFCANCAGAFHHDCVDPYADEKPRLCSRCGSTQPAS